MTIDQRVLRRSQPQAMVALDSNNPITDGITIAYVPWIGRYGYDLVAKRFATFSGSASNLQKSRNGDGVGLGVGYDNSGNGIVVAPSCDAVIGTSTASFLILFINQITQSTWRSFAGANNTTNTAPSVVLGYGTGVAGQLAFAFGDASAGSGMVTATKTISGAEQFRLGFIAGPTKGREIWNGAIKIASDAGAIATRAATDKAFWLGNPATTGGGAGIASQIFVAWNRELADAEMRSALLNPWQLLAPFIRQVFGPDAAAAGGFFARNYYDMIGQSRIGA